MGNRPQSLLNITRCVLSAFFLLALIPSKFLTKFDLPKTKTLTSDSEVTHLLVLDFEDEVKVEVEITKHKTQGETTSNDLVIKNQTSNKILWSKKDIGYVLSLYTRDLTNDDAPELIITTTPGVVGEAIEILSINASQVSVLFSHFYRGDAAIVALSTNLSSEIFITDAKSSTSQFFTSRYRWNGERYSLVGKAPFLKFTGSINQVFKAK